MSEERGPAARASADRAGIYAWTVSNTRLRRQQQCAALDRDIICLVGADRFPYLPIQLPAWCHRQEPQGKGSSQLGGAVLRSRSPRQAADRDQQSRLRDLVELMIQRHLPPDQFTTLKAERVLIAGLVGMMPGGRP
jgi:hypothetical protein